MFRRDKQVQIPTNGWEASLVESLFGRPVDLDVGVPTCDIEIRFDGFVWTVDESEKSLRGYGSCATNGPAIPSVVQCYSGAQVRTEFQAKTELERVRWAASDTQDPYGRVVLDGRVSGELVLPSIELELYLDQGGWEDLRCVFELPIMGSCRAWFRVGVHPKMETDEIVSHSRASRLLIYRYVFTAETAMQGAELRRNPLYAHDME